MILSCWEAKLGLQVCGNTGPVVPWYSTFCADLQKPTRVEDILGCKRRNATLSESGWALTEQIGINAKRFVLLGLGWSHLSKAWWIEESAGGAGVWDGNSVGVCWELRGGLVDSGPLPVGYKRSVWEGPDSAPFSSCFFRFLSLSKDKVNRLSVGRQEQLLCYTYLIQPCFYCQTTCWAFV